MSDAAERTPVTDAERWAAVAARDPRCDGQFVFAVKTTGVYCRPSCKARPPRRENVRFFDGPSQAQAAGFRPCKRCAPDQAAHEAQVTAQVCAFIDSHLDERLTLETLGAVAGFSPHHLQRVFKRAMGLSPHDYLAARRMNRLKANLRDGQDVTGALYAVGFSSSSRVYERADSMLGMTPATVRKGGLGMHITYTLAESPLGWLLVAGTARGICAVELADTPAEAEACLQRDYPQAEITRAAGDLTRAVEQIIAHLSGSLPHVDLPLDLQATAFQLRVWQALRAIPYGETRSYQQVAEAIGEPTASRAVAQACAQNRVALLIPCHRVVRAGGGISGYKWGVERKARLLRLERHGV